MPAKKPRTDPLRGDLAVVEDNRIVLYHVDRDLERGYGATDVTRYPTHARASDFDPSLFPARVELDLGGYHVVFPGRSRARVTDQDIDRDHVIRQTNILSEEELTPRELDNRWRYLREVLKDAGRLVVISAAGRLPRRSRAMFWAWAGALTLGMPEDEATDALYADFGVDLANEFFRAARTPRAAYDARGNTVFILEPVKRATYVPLAHHGELPVVDWTRVPR